MLMVSIFRCVGDPVSKLALRALANGIARNQYFVYRNSLARPAAEKSRISERYKLFSPYSRCTRTSSVCNRSNHGFISF